MADEDDGDDEDGELDEYVMRISHPHTTDWGATGILTMRIQVTKSDDRPPSCWQL